MSKKPFPCKDVINEWMEDTTKTLQIRIAGSDSNWTDCRHQVPVLSDQFEYRIADKPEPLNIQFPHNLSAQWKYIAMNAEGTWFAYKDKPNLKVGEGNWVNDSGDWNSLMRLTNILVMPMLKHSRWKETLTKRP